MWSKGLFYKVSNDVHNFNLMDIKLDDGHLDLARDHMPLDQVHTITHSLAHNKLPNVHSKSKANCCGFTY